MGDVGHARFDDLTVEPIYRAEKLGDIGAVGLVIDFHGRAHLQKFAGLHERDLVGDGHGFDLVVGDIEHRGAELFGQLADLAAHLFAQAGVEIAQRLVHQEQARIHGDGARQGDALLLPAAEQSRRAVGLFFQLNQPERFFDPVGDFACAGSVAILQPEERDILRDRKMGPDGIGLKNHAQLALLRRQSR